MHVRAQIRAAVVQSLSGLPTTGSRVFTSRVDPISDSQLPALVIETNGEAVSEFRMFIDSPVVLSRELDLVVAIRAKVSADLDDVLDAIAEQVEPALLDPADPSFGGLVQLVMYDGLQIAFTGELDRPAAEARMRFRFRYHTSAGMPGSPFHQE